MATMLDPPAVVAPGRTTHSSARKMADKASRTAIERAGLAVDEVDLLLNTGLYRDRNLGEPALAALIQEDVGINPEDPHAGMHGTFSFDIANGGCGVLTALQIADGFLQSATIDHALVVASDADPGHGMALGFPFLARGAAVVCHWEEGPGGLVGFQWGSAPEDGDLFRSRFGFERRRNLLRVEQDPDFGWRGGSVGGENGEVAARRTRLQTVRRRPCRRQSLDAGLPRWAVCPCGHRQRTGRRRRGSGAHTHSGATCRSRRRRGAGAIGRGSPDSSRLGGCRSRLRRRCPRSVNTCSDHKAQRRSRCGRPSPTNDDLAVSKTTVARSD